MSAFGNEAVILIDSLEIDEMPVGQSEAADHLLTGSGLSTIQRRFLDIEGNGDGVFNLGDVLAHLDRTGPTRA